MAFWLSGQKLESNFESLLELPNEALRLDMVLKDCPVETET